jgi:hypothetical protein
MTNIGANAGTVRHSLKTKPHRQPLLKASVLPAHYFDGLRVVIHAGSLGPPKGRAGGLLSPAMPTPHSGLTHSTRHQFVRNSVDTSVDKA